MQIDHKIENMQEERIRGAHGSSDCNCGKFTVTIKSLCSYGRKSCSPRFV